MKKTGFLKRLFAAVFLGNTIRSLRPQVKVSGGMGQAMLNSILIAGGAEAQASHVSYATAKAASMRITSLGAKTGIALISSAVVVTSCAAYAVISAMNTAAVPAFHISVSPTNGYVNSYVNIAVEIEDPLTPLADYNDNLTAQQGFVTDTSDRDFPYVESCSLQGDTLLIVLRDESSGIDLSQVYCLDKKGRKMYPTQIRQEESMVVFQLSVPEDDETLDIELYFSDNADNESYGVIHVLFAAD